MTGSAIMGAGFWVVSRFIATRLELSVAWVSGSLLALVGVGACPYDSADNKMHTQKSASAADFSISLSMPSNTRLFETNFFAAIFTQLR